jgi:hypothetical protein
MRLHRRSRRWLSGWLTVMLLLTQWLTSAYACPMQAGASSGAAVAASMPGCDGHMPGARDPEQPQLCQMHCSQGAQTVQSAPGADLPPAPAMLLALLDWTQAALAPRHSAGRPAPLATGAPPPGSPPLYLRLLVLRN